MPAPQLLEAAARSALAQLAQLPSLAPPERSRSAAAAGGEQPAGAAALPCASRDLGQISPDLGHISPELGQISPELATLCWGMAALGMPCTSLPGAVLPLVCAQQPVRGSGSG